MPGTQSHAGRPDAGGARQRMNMETEIQFPIEAIVIAFNVNIGNTINQTETFVEIEPET